MEEKIMKIIYKYTGKERKALVEAISAELGIPAVYNFAPTFSYTIGGYTVDKEGTLRGDDNRELVGTLYELYAYSALRQLYDAPLPEADTLTITRRGFHGSADQRQSGG